MAYSQGMSVNSFETVSDIRSLSLGSATAQEATSWRTDGLSALLVTFYPAPFPCFAIRSTSYWDFTATGGLAFDCYNPASIPVTLGIRAEDQAGIASTREIALQPNKASYIRLTYQSETTPDPLVYGVRTLPSPFPELQSFRSYNAAGFNPGRIVRIRYYLRSPGSAISLLFDNVRLLSSFSMNQLLTGCCDQYGQYTRLSWPGKLKSKGDFSARMAAERRDLASHPKLGDRDQYGGWAHGPLLTGTGYFRTTRINGKWWLVTPEGRLFYSIGVNGITLRYGQTMVTGRQPMFAWLPATTDPLYKHTVYTNRVLVGPVKEGYAYNFVAANAERKFGATYAADWVSQASLRLPAWGFNTVGAWSDDALARSHTIPYVVALSTAAFAARVSTGSDLWGAIPDPYSSDFPTAVHDILAPVVKSTGKDSWCLGYFVDNELSWAGVGANAAIALAYGALERDSKLCPAKSAFIGQLKKKYPTINELDRAWKTNLSGWTALGRPYAAPPSPNAVQLADMTDFVRAFAKRYFSTVRAQIKALDPNHLYLGCRFASGRSTPAVEYAAAESCDVISFNIYMANVSGEQWNRLIALNRPCLVSEFHFGTLDAGLWDGGQAPIADRNDRALAYQAYVQSVLDHPAFVGCHWYQYNDAPLTGRILDGSNGAIGLVDVTDTPYVELSSAARTVNRSAYTRRYNGM